MPEAATPVATTEVATQVVAIEAATPELATEAIADVAAEAEPELATAAPAAAPVANELTPAACAAKLKGLFPALFGGNAFKPLKLRVQADIQERAAGVFTKTQLSAFLRRHTGNTGYLIALGKATHRYDLDGQPASELTDEHRLAAREELTRRRGLQQERVGLEQERVELEQQQRHNRAGLLHDFEITTLTLPNFCALKGVTAEELPGLLDIARAERLAQPVREARPAQPARGGRERPNEREAGAGTRDARDQRNPRGRPAARR
jgi:ProP effector